MQVNKILLNLNFIKIHHNNIIHFKLEHQIKVQTILIFLSNLKYGIFLNKNKLRIWKNIWILIKKIKSIYNLILLIIKRK